MPLPTNRGSFSGRLSLLPRARTLAAGWVLLPIAVSVAQAGGASGDHGRVFLWKVDSGTSTVYLLGSIHLARRELYPMNPAIEEAYERASTLVVEANTNSADPSALQKRMLEKGTYPDGGTWMSRIGEKDLERILGYLEERAMPLEELRNMKPWLLSLTLTAVEMRRLGYDPRLGMDRYFLNRATEEEKPILELESADYQIELLSGLSEELQELLLAYTIREMDELPDRIQEIMNAWSRGDAEALEDAILKRKRADERFRPVHEKLLFERSARMAEKIRELLGTENSYFVVVGAGHLVGKRGILELLERAGKPGYAIEQVSSNRPASLARTGP